MKLLDDNGIPNGVTPGNHDNKTGPDNDLFNEFFPPARYDAAEDIAPTGDDGEGYYGGPWQPADNQNHYDLIEAGGQKLLFLYLGSSSSRRRSPGRTRSWPTTATARPSC